MFTRLTLLFACLCALPSNSPAAETPQIRNPQSAIRTVKSPLTPAQAIASFQIEPGLRVEAAATEPLVVDPVAIAFDERGRMFVAENRGYPTGPGTNKPPEGVIALLEDTDGDGRFDKRTVFADGLTFPNGILCWRGGVFVTCAPDIFYFKDTDGDGKADVKKVVLTGFNDKTTTQLRVSHPALGLDGWVYVTSGLTGGKVTSPEHPERAAVDFTKSDTRFHPDTFEFETTAGQGQFGLTFDDFGRKFVCSNRNPCQHIVLLPRELKRNPFLAFSDTVQDAARFGDAGKVWPLSPDTTTAGFMPGLMSAPHAGTFTSACGLRVFTGTALTPAHVGNVFICEPAQNLVQRQAISPNGATFTAKPAREGADFLASPDNWFRPVFAANGPDGSLYICDMYRKTIEHPQYLPESMRATTDFVSGKTMGRIWRIVAEKHKAASAKLQLDRVSTKKLCEELSNANGWIRETARRLLLERKDKAAEPVLRDLARDTRSKNPNGAAARVAALRLMEILGSLDAKTITGALADPHPSVREHAVQLAASRLVSSADLLARVSALADDPDPRVRFECALALGEAPDARNMAVLAKIGLRDGTDRWTRAAVMSSMGRYSDDFFKALQSSPTKSSEAFPLLMADLGRIFGVSQPLEKCVTLLKELASTNGHDDSWRPNAVLGLAEGLRSRGLAKGGRSPLMSLLTTDSAESRAARERLDALFTRSTRLALETNAPASERIPAISLLAQADYPVGGPTLLRLISPKHPTDIQVAAVRAFGQLNEPGVSATLVTRERWRTYLPPVREAALATVLSQSRHVPSLLDAVERGDVQPWSIEPTRRNQLLQSKDPTIKERAQLLFKGQGAGDRMKVYEEYKSVLTLAPNSKNGHEVFKRVCANCHTHTGEGSAVGPDLTGVRNQPAEALLLHILVPSYEIVAGFTSYDIELKDGRSLSGLIASETESSVTLRRALAEQETVLRSNIVSINSGSLSLMPDELEKGMTKQELADLVAFLKGQ